ncbi:MAG: hypothetical protein R3D03_15610 [Geminicoccaceae bacterium]
MVYPLIIGRICLIASIVGTYLIKLGSDNNIMKALYKGSGRHGVSLVALFPFTALVLGIGTEYTTNTGTVLRHGRVFLHRRPCGYRCADVHHRILHRHGISPGEVPSLRRRPPSHGTNVIQGLAISMEACAMHRSS